MKLSLLILLLVAAAVVVATGDNPFGVVLVIGLVAMAALAAGALRPSNHPGQVEVLTASGTITARSRRLLIIWLLALLLVAAATGLAYAFTLAAPGDLPRRTSGIFLIAVGCFFFAAWRLIAAVTSTDLRLDAEGVHLSSPVRRSRLISWDEIELTTGTDTSLVLLLSDGTEASFPIGHQASDPQVLRALVDRCSAFPGARARIGDAVLDDLLAEAAPHGSFPGDPPTARARRSR